VDVLPVFDLADASDAPSSWPIVDRVSLGRGAVAEFVGDTLRTPDGELIKRQYLLHHGAVAVVALDDHDRVVVVRQYRHPVGFVLTEIPAGLLDAPGESYVTAAQRELAEEAGIAAADWRVLVDYMATPGSCEESARIFLARDLRRVDRPEGFSPEGEEAHMEVGLVAFDDLVAGILQGRLQSPSLTLGILALEAARRGGRMNDLRRPDAPWPARAQRASDRA
jgi:8-oxo-dGDP phosphatase